MRIIHGQMVIVCLEARIIVDRILCFGGLQIKTKQEQTDKRKKKVGAEV